jgi:hypothetical protein
MRTINETLLAAADGTTSPSSAALCLGNMAGFSIQAIVTGTLAGTLILQASNDVGTTINGITADPASLTNWTPITGSSQSISGAGTVMYNTDEYAFYRWVRAVYTNSSGTGTLTINANAKG